MKKTNELHISLDNPPDCPPFDQLQLHPEILRGLEDLKFERPRAIQAAVLPDALAGRDILGCSETGSGKTVAFLLPMIQRLAGQPRKLRALILEPTRELAMQVKDVADELARYTGLRSVVCFGGVPLKLHLNALRDGADILIATPGRLIDLTWQGAIDYRGIESLVIDEVDRMFDMGFIEDVEKIIGFLPREPFQKMGFSATLDRQVRRLLDPIMNDPLTVVVGRSSKAAEGITQKMYAVEAADKLKALTRILCQEKPGPMLIFTETKINADRVYRELRQQGFPVRAFHSGYDQIARFDTLKMFREGKIQLLVATNVAARGLDISGITHIINFDVPRHCEDYVHRIGRSARGDATGTAITIATIKDIPWVKKILQLIDQEIPLYDLPEFSARGFAERLGVRSLREGKISLREEKPGRPERENVRRGGRLRRERTIREEPNQREPRREREEPPRYARNRYRERPEPGQDRRDERDRRPRRERETPRSGRRVSAREEEYRLRQLEEEKYRRETRTRQDRPADPRPSGSGRDEDRLRFRRETLDVLPADLRVDEDAPARHGRFDDRRRPRDEKKPVQPRRFSHRHPEESRDRTRQERKPDTGDRQPLSRQERSERFSPRAEEPRDTGQQSGNSDQTRKALPAFSADAERMQRRRRFGLRPREEGDPEPKPLREIRKPADGSPVPEPAGKSEPTGGKTRQERLKREVVDQTSATKKPVTREKMSEVTDEQTTGPKPTTRKKKAETPDAVTETKKTRTRKKASETTDTETTDKKPTTRKKKAEAPDAAPATKKTASRKKVTEATDEQTTGKKSTTRKKKIDEVTVSEPRVRKSAPRKK